MRVQCTFAQKHDIYISVTGISPYMESKVPQNYETEIDVTVSETFNN